MRYVFETRVISVTREERHLSSRKVGDEVQVEKEDLGWFVLLDGSHEKLSVGPDKPELEKGDRVRVTMEKIA